MKKCFLAFIAFLLVNLNLLGSETYILPKESKQAFKKLEQLIKDSKNKIDIAVYNFEYKKVAKLLKKRAKKGVQVNIYFEQSKLENKKAKYDYLCKEKNIKCKISKKKKQHIKLMVFDDTTAMFGSANLTKESFLENLELLYITSEEKTIRKFRNFFITIF